MQDNTQAPIVSTLQNYKYFVGIWRSKASNQKTWTPQQEDKYFEGSVEEDSFKISRHIIGRGGAFMADMNPILRNIYEQPAELTHLIPDAIMLTVPFWAYVCYRYEVRKAKRKLNEMLGSCDL